MNASLFMKTYLPLRSVILAVCKQMMSNEEEAEDITQDIYLKLWEDRQKLDEVISPKSFVIRVARNLCLDRLKSPAKRLKSENSGAEELAIASPSCNPYESLLAREQKILLEKWASQLKEPKRSIFKLRHFEMLSNQETADKLGIPEPTVRSTLSRLRKEARKILLEE